MSAELGFIKSSNASVGSVDARFVSGPVTPLPIIEPQQFETITIAAGGGITPTAALSTTLYASRIVSSATAPPGITVTLADGSKTGQLKVVRLEPAGGATITISLTPANLRGFTTLGLAPTAGIHPYVLLQWSGMEWVVLDHLSVSFIA